MGAHFYLEKRERVAWLLAGPPPFPATEDHGVILKDAVLMVIPVEVELKSLVSGSAIIPGRGRSAARGVSNAVCGAMVLWPFSLMVSPRQCI